MNKSAEELPNGMKAGSLKINHIQKSIFTLKQKEAEIAGGGESNIKTETFNRMNEELTHVRDQHGLRNVMIEPSEPDLR